MKAALVSVALWAVLALAQNFTINTPSNVVECQPTQLTWNGGQEPYYLSVLPGGNPSGSALETFPATNSTSYTWTVNIAAGTSIGFTLRDSNGLIAQTAPVTVNPGTTSCANVTSVSGVSPTGSSTSAAATSAGTTAIPNSAGTTLASSPSTAAASSASASSASTSGASANIAQLGAAGIVGVAIAALFL